MEAQACSWGQGFSLIDWLLEWICAKNPLAETTELLLKIKSLSGLSPKGLFYVIIIIIIIIVIITIILKKYQRLAHSVAVSPSVTHAPILQSHLKASLVTQLATSRFELSDDYWRKRSIHICFWASGESLVLQSGGLAFGSQHHRLLALQIPLYSSSCTWKAGSSCARCTTWNRVQHLSAQTTWPIWRVQRDSDTELGNSQIRRPGVKKNRQAEHE